MNFCTNKKNYSVKESKQKCCETEKINTCVNWHSKIIILAYIKHKYLGKSTLECLIVVQTTKQNYKTKPLGTLKINV